MKIVKLEIQETTINAPRLERIKEREPLPVTMMTDGMDITDLDSMPAYKTEIYPLETFATDKETYERFYIREQDKKMFEEFTNKFVQAERLRLLRQILEHVHETNGKDIENYLFELQRFEKEKLVKRVAE